MPLVPSVFKTELKTFIANANTATQADLDSAINNFCSKLEKVVYDAIKSATVTINIAPGQIIVAGSSVTQTNVSPLVLTGTVT